MKNSAQCVMRTYSRKKPPVKMLAVIQSVCRLCLRKTKEMSSVFDSDDNFSSLSLKIATCLGLEISRHDALPKYICQDCNSELNRLCTFKKICCTNNQKLQVLLSNKADGTSKKTVNSSDGNTGIASSMRSRKNSTENISSEAQVLQIYKDIDMPGIAPSTSLFMEDNINDKNETETQPVIVTNSDCTQVNAVSSGTELKNQTLQIEVQQVAYENDKMDQNILNPVLDGAQTQKENEEDTSSNVETQEIPPGDVVAALVEAGVLANRDDTLEVLKSDCKTFNLETINGYNVVMALFEEESETPTEATEIPGRKLQVDPNCKDEGRNCRTCGAQLSSRGALVRHMRIHSGEKPFPCGTCGRRFAQAEVLRRHQLVHSDNLPYQCSSCPKAYTQRGALQAHVLTHTQDSARPLTLHRCQHCPKIFIYPSGLSRHMSVHQGRDFPCSECSRTFNDKSSLKRHIRIHQRVRAR